MMFAQYENAVVIAVYRCAQPDALDDDGNVIAKGVDTVELPDDHPDILAFLNPTGNRAIIESIVALESSEPVTQRALREMILAIGQAFPQAQQTIFYQKAAAQDAQIVALRSQLK